MLNELGYSNLPQEWIRHNISSEFYYFDANMDSENNDSISGSNSVDYGQCPCCGMIGSYCLSDDYEDSGMIY